MFCLQWKSIKKLKIIYLSRCYVLIKSLIWKFYFFRLKIHFIHVKPKKTEGKKVLPLLLLHGWPGSVREFYDIIPLLTTPNDKSDYVFEVVAPSLVGYGWSQVNYNLSSIHTIFIYSSMQILQFFSLLLRRTLVQLRCLLWCAILCCVWVTTNSSSKAVTGVPLLAPTWPPYFPKTH